MQRVAILTVSDRCSNGKQEDLSGPAIADCLRASEHALAWYGIVPDEQEEIMDKLKYLCEFVDVDIILTTGGTGLSPRDVTPEATLQLADRVVPGIAEAMRAQTAAQAPRSMLSRGVVVAHGHKLIINLPGSPKAVRECMCVILPVLDHAANVLKGAVRGCAATP